MRGGVLPHPSTERLVQSCHILEPLQLQADDRLLC